MNLIITEEQRQEVINVLLEFPAKYTLHVLDTLQNLKPCGKDCKTECKEQCKNKTK